MANQDLFKEAIAEAKSIREAAIANAREALEETLTPHLKSMLAARLQEMEEEEEVKEEVEEVEELDEAQGNIDAHEENPSDQLEEELEEAKADDEEAEDDSEKSEDEAEEEEAEEEAEEEVEVKDMEVEDLKELIRDIISQEMGAMGEEEVGDEEMALDGDAEAQPVDMISAEDEEIDLDELLAELEGLTEGEEEVEEVSDKEKEAMKEEMASLQTELTSALDAIKELRKNLSEVNLLNAKLLYLNKIFRNNNLTENQKVSTISAFDKANSPKEVKLVYETLKESFVTKPQTIKENKGFASKAAGVAPKKEVLQVNEQVLRMQKLAGIIQ